MTGATPPRARRGSGPCGPGRGGWRRAGHGATSARLRETGPHGARRRAPAPEPRRDVGRHRYRALHRQISTTRLDGSAPTACAPASGRPVSGDSDARSARRRGGMGDAGRGGTGEEGSTFLTRAPAPPTGEMWRADAATASSRQSPVMPRRLRPLPDSLRWNVFTTAEARAAGVSGGRLQAGDVIRIGRGLYARSEMPADATDASVDQSGSAPGQAGIHDRRDTSGHLVHDPTTDREGPPPSSADPSDDGVHAVREADVIRALQRADPDAVACGLSAARLWRLPLPRGLPRGTRELLSRRSR